MQTKRDSILPSCFQRFDSKGIILKLQLPRIKSILRAMNKGHSCFHLVWYIVVLKIRNGSLFSSRGVQGAPSIPDTS